MNYRSLNEAIESVTNPQPKNEALTSLQEQEYIAMLESALESIAEAMECSVEDLLEDVQTPQRKAEGEKDIKNLKGTYKRRIKKAARTPLNSKASDDAMTRANDTLTDLSNRTAKNDTERKSTELYGHRGKIIKKK